MGQTLPKPKSKGETPAPWDYRADVDKTKVRVPSYSMTPRGKISNSKRIGLSLRKFVVWILAESKGPSPNAYSISRGQTNKGTSTGKSCSLSSRHSPYKYAGFPTAALAKL